MGSEILWPQAQVCTVDLTASAVHTGISRDWGCKREIRTAHRNDQVAEHTVFMFVKRNTTVLA